MKINHESEISCHITLTGTAVVIIRTGNSQVNMVVGLHTLPAHIFAATLTLYDTPKEGNCCKNMEK